MPNTSNLETRFCVVWETNWQTRKASLESPYFSFQNLQWKLMLKSLGNYSCTLTLHAPPNVPLERKFRATILLEKKNVSETPIVCAVQTVKSSNQVLWNFDVSELALYGTTYTNGIPVNFVCLLEYLLSHSLVPQSSKGTIHPSGSPRSFDLPPNLESMSLDFSKLLKDEVLSDVKLKSAERTISAHRAVLAARSEVFSAMFRNKMVESETGTVDVTDLDARALQMFLGYVYTGQIKGLSEDLAPSVYAAADKYAVHCLKKDCSDQMIAGLTKDNCVSFLTVADEHSDADFKGAVVSFICGHEAILLSEVWLSFSEKHLKLANEVYQSFVRSKSY